MILTVPKLHSSDGLCITIVERSIIVHASEQETKNSEEQFS
jgi:hypothetical protein